MKQRTLLCFVALITVAQSMWAEDVTPEEALWQAQNFMQQRVASGSRPRKAQGVLQLTATQQVSGLYIFNVADNEGFVIVSNDDRTIPVLGYSDNGSIDPDNMPENMKAWLQGYADEIAWLASLNDQTTNSPNDQSKAPSRVGSHETTEIKPLLSTKWDQDEPYNNLCPEYEAGKKSVTGCVATAMAQVMNYHKWPTAETTAIPEYKCATLDKTLEELPATTFDWANMINNYSGEYTSTQANAVAKLMQYCGHSVKMNYGETSGARTSRLETAFINYFNYKSTTKYVSRSYYSYANWTDLIYNELKQKRPVIYAGDNEDASSGHCFVCDGYKFEESTDLFHINWGWGGNSDGYFVLSVLNPYDQGIGGSSTNSAYNTDHEAIIGIQKSSDEGTVLDVPVNAINLTVNSIAVSHATIALGESVAVTINVKNNSSDAYDGELILSVSNSWNISKMFLIPSEETKDCVITYTPSRTGTITLKVGYPNGKGGYTAMDKFVDLNVVNQTPTGLTVSNTTSESATIGWTNVGEATKWNMRYSMLTKDDFNDMMTDDLNSSIDKWAISNRDIDKHHWELNPGNGIDKSQCMASPSYLDGVGDLNPDNLLLTPGFDYGGSFSFYAWGEGEHFRVYIYSGNHYYSPISEEIVATNTPTEYYIDLTPYNGPGWLAIRHFNSSGHTFESYLYIDDVTFGTPWTTVNNITNPYTLSGLSAVPNYEAQVQAVNNDGGNWSESVRFTTTNNSFALLNDDRTAEMKNAGLIAAWNGCTANVTLSGRTLWKDGAWNTLCLPFDVSTTSGPLAGDNVVAMILNTATSGLTGTTLTLNFDNAPATIPAGTPFIIKWGTPESHPSSNLTTPTFTGVTISNATTNNEQTFSCGKFVGTYSPVSFTAENKSILFLGEEDTLYYPDGSTATTINAFRAYFQLNSPVAVKEFKLSFYDEDSVDGIGATLNDKGQMINDNAIYNLAGQRMSKMQRGINIVNGRKVLQ